MLNNDQDRPTGTLLPSQKFMQVLFEPHATITEVGARRQARLLSIIALIITATNFIGLLTVVFLVQPDGSGFPLLLVTAVSIFGYALSRTRWNKLGGYTIVWALVLAAIGGNPNNLSVSLYTNLTPAIVIASIIFSFRYMVFFVTLINVFIVAAGFLPFVYPNYSNPGIDLAVFLPFSILIVAGMRYRENVERDRLTELKRINLELTTLSAELEQRVEDRTEKLKEQSRRMQAVAEVARTAASFQDLDRLLTSSTRLISESFGYYHAGIFLLDEEAQYAVLRAANSEGGQRMLSRMHKLPVDLSSIVGYTAKTQTARIALDTEADSIYFNNPDLPETRSELAVPLKVGLRLIGILDVQSTEKNAFVEEDIAIISTLADQLAVAMDNTRLLTETRRALITTEQTYQRYFSQSWSQFVRHLNINGYRYQAGKVILLEGNDENQATGKSGSKLSIPLIVRGQDIGTIEVYPKDEKRGWTPDELSLLEIAAERAALSLEHARLLQDAQKQAAKERTISEGAARVSSALDVENILKVTAEELERALGSSEIVIQLESEE